MKFDLSDFVQLDTKGLLNVNGGGSCSGSSSSSSDSSSSGNGGSSDNGGGSSSPDSGSTKVYIPTGPNNGYYAEKPSRGSKNGNGGGSSSGGSGGGSCNGASDGKTIHHNPYYESNTEIESDNQNEQGSGPGSTTQNGGGTCSRTSKPKTDSGATTTPTIPASGSFGQITDGSYADKLTMQYYMNGNIEARPFYIDSPGTSKMHDYEMYGDNRFSTDGCLITCVTKVVSEKSGKTVYLTDISKNVDKNCDGLLSFSEIKNGLENYLGDEYNIESHWYEGSLSEERFAEAAAKENTYVLGRAVMDLNHDGIDEHHWVILEGYTKDLSGRLVFSYDGSSDNDFGRTYVFGTADSNKNEYRIDKIETFTITRK